jgi:poly(3-hydroxybutyrate) depolymerase
MWFWRLRKNGAMRTCIVVCVLLTFGCQGTSNISIDATDEITGDAPLDADLDVVHGPLACAPACNPQTGTCGPLQTCTTTNPCSVTDGDITDSITMPSCRTTAAGRTAFDDGAPLTWTGAAGNPRAACIHIPSTATASAKVPLVIFLHGSHGSADDLYNYTSLRNKAQSFVLETGRTGFAVASMQGRNLHWLGSNPAGSHHDNLFRDLGAPSTNPDVADLDHLIDTLVAGGTINPARVYVMGWSNGAFFAQLYAIARYTVATPGGNHVAAVVAFAGADPFADATGNDTSCRLATYPRSTVPVLLIHRACDALVPCSESQAIKHGVVSGYAIEPWIAQLEASAGVDDPNVIDMIFDGQGGLVANCTAAALCTQAIGTLNHLRWPDGVADGSGLDREPALLTFLKNHPHS